MRFDKNSQNQTIQRFCYDFVRKCQPSRLLPVPVPVPVPPTPALILAGLSGVCVCVKRLQLLLITLTLVLRTSSCDRHFGRQAAAREPPCTAERQLTCKSAANANDMLNLFSLQI